MALFFHIYIKMYDTKAKESQGKTQLDDGIL